MKAVTVFRGSWVESCHEATVAVVDGRGRLTHRLGDPERLVVIRSSAKPFQLLPLLLSGAAERFGFADRHLAIMAGSHNGTDTHRAVVLEALAAAGRDPGQLRCGTHVPLEHLLRGQVPRQGEEQDPLRHNCSGKHAGFLAQAAHLGEGAAGYLDPDSETQRRVRQVLADFCEVPASELGPCVDGCSAPNYSVPLASLALGYLKLATARTTDVASVAAVRRVTAAMQAEPEMVSGEGRLDLDLSQAFPGRILCKVGGEAIEAMAFADPPLGIAVKIHDGAFRALRPVCVEVLRQLGLVDEPLGIASLRRHVRPELRNDAGLPAGHLETCFELERLG